MAIRWRPVKVNITTPHRNDSTVLLGRGIVREVVGLTDTEPLAICYVIRGFLVRMDRIRIIRAGVRVHSTSGDRLELRALVEAHPGEDIVNVNDGRECFLRVRGFELATGDVVETYRSAEE
jgi:hypothetical protein